MHTNLFDPANKNIVNMLRCLNNLAVNQIIFLHKYKMICASQILTGMNVFCFKATETAI